MRLFKLIGPLGKLDKLGPTDWRRPMQALSLFARQRACVRSPRLNP